MIFRVVIEEQAALDIAEYGLWIVGQGAPLNAERWIDGIEEAIRSLSSMPERFPRAPESGVIDRPIRQFHFKSHRVLFTVEGSVVHVLHVRHGARLPEEPRGSPGSSEL